MSTKRVFIFIMLVATLLTGATFTQAQNGTGTGEYVGVLEALNGNQLQVSGLIFDISTAEFDDDLLLEPGTLAEISFSATGGVLTAVYVDDADADEFTGVGEIMGDLQAYTPEAAAIGGITFDITGAEIDDDVVFAVGTPTEIRFTFAGGVFSGYKIEADDQADDTDDENDDDLEDAVAYGEIEAIDGATLTVAGVVFDISTAEIDDDGTLEVGLWVRVEFYINETGTAIATSVEFDDDSDDATEEEEEDTEDFTLVGILESFEGSVMVVSGVTVDVSQAVLDDDDNIVVGALVKVEFDDVDGVLVAISVEDVDDIDDVDDEFEDDDLLGDDDSDDSNDDSDDSSDDDGSDDSDNDSSDDDSCQIPAGWYEYEIRSGDTLSGIAVAANIALADLMSANCITDASLIRVDDEIYTPVQISSGGGSDDSDDSDDDNGGDDDSDDSDDDNGGDDDSDDSDDDNGGDDDGDDDSDDDDDNGGGDDEGDDD